MAQHDFNIANATFPSVRSDINSALTAINTTQSGTSRPASAVAGTIWLDTTSATTPTLKYYDGADDISLATLDHSANTVNWLDSTVSITGLSSTATGTVLTLTDSDSKSTVNLIIDNQKEVRFNETTANGTNYIGLKAPASVTADLTFTLPVAPTADNQALVASTTGVMSFTPYAFPSADGTSGQALVTSGAGVLSFATTNITPTVNTFDTGTGATYTKPTTANWILVELWGGGGSGGRAGSAQASGGGGGGAYASFQIPFADLVDTVTYTVGAGGAAATSNNTNGNVGGTSSVSFANFQGLGTTKTISAFGGGGGRAANASNTQAGGSGGGFFAAGTVNGNGDLGIKGTISILGAAGDAVSGCGGYSSAGGNNIFGGGGGGAALTTTARVGGSSYYGGGGGAGHGTSSGNTALGGTSVWGGDGGTSRAASTVGDSGTLPAGGGAASLTANSGAGGGGRIRFTYW
jgi:hypothetical protein